MDLHVIAQRDKSSARALLIERLMSIHDGGKVRVTIVFDGRGNDLVVEHPTAEPSFSVLYMQAGTTADDVIEHMVANSATPSECCVATEDRAERETITAAGAHAIDAPSLAAWVERVGAHQTRTLSRLREANSTAWKRP